MSYFSFAESWGHDANGFACGAWITTPGTVYRPGPANHHALLWVLDGFATVECEGERYEIPPNGIYWAPPWIGYAVRWDTRRTTRWGWMNFASDEGLELPRLRLSRTDDILIPLLNHMVALSIDKPSGWRVAIKAVSDYALQVLASDFSSTRIAHESVYSDLIVRSIAAIQRHWLHLPMRVLPLARLAAELGVTPRHLSRVFLTELGVAPGTAMRTSRILLAARLLTGTARPIREIASELGFANHYHFSAAFKSTMGVPPGAYRLRPPAETPVPAQLARLAGYFAGPLEL